jgi:hypothetical protein
MIELQGVEELISYALFSAWVKDERPLSLMIISRVESGKTETVRQFIWNKGILVMTDCTYWGIVSRYKDQLMSGEINHIIIPDMIIPINRSKDTVNSLIAFLNALTEEGVNEVVNYAFPDGLNLTHPIRAGIITTIARPDFERWKDRWAAVGFTSRFLPVCYDYTEATRDKIFNALIFRRETSKQITLDFPKEPQYVYLPPGIATSAMQYAKAIGKAIETYGFRAQRQLQTLMMSRALKKSRDEVKKEDFDCIVELSEYFYPSHAKEI